MKAAKNTPSVYVGTWKKYNSGNLGGAWIDLTECGTYDGFLQRCKEVHRNEKDPEFMVQDTENFPDGLDITDWLTEQEFNDVMRDYMESLQEKEEEKPSYEIVYYSEKAFAVTGDTRSIKDELKQLGGRFNAKLKCGAGWIFSKKVMDDVRKLLESGNVSSSSMDADSNQPGIGEVLKANLKEYAQITNDDYYNIKRYVGAVKIDEAYYLIEKLKIENRFCFHDEGPDYDFYCSLIKDEKKLEQYFISENENEFTKKIKYMKKSELFFVTNKECRQIYLCGCEMDAQRFYAGPNFEYHRITDEERKAIIDGLEYGLSELRKRLNTYLKRYGTSKIHTWTYWADR